MSNVGVKKRSDGALSTSEALKKPFWLKRECRTVSHLKKRGAWGGIYRTHDKENLLILFRIYHQRKLSLIINKSNVGSNLHSGTNMCTLYMYEY